MSNDSRAAAKRSEASGLRTQAAELHAIGRGANAAAQIVRNSLAHELGACIEEARKQAAKGEPVAIDKLLRTLAGRVQEASEAFATQMLERVVASEARAAALEEFAAELESMDKPVAEAPSGTALEALKRVNGAASRSTDA